MSDCLIVFSGGPYPIEGETDDAEHPSAVAIESWDWEILPRRGEGTHDEVGRDSQISDLVFTQTIDKATPVFVNYASTNYEIKSADMYMRRAGGREAAEYLTMSFKDVVVKSVSIAYGGGPLEVPKAVVKMSYREIEIVYKPQDKTGKALGAVSFSKVLYAKP